MNICTVSHEAIVSLKENLLPSLTALQKKILIVVAIALVFFVAWFVINRRISFEAKPLNNRPDMNKADLQEPPNNLVDSSQSDQSDTNTAENLNFPSDLERLDRPIDADFNK
jgi:hypothetical protein